jgi:hypothetical protein
VLTLAVGPNGTLICKLWCEPQTTESACHHDDGASGATVTASDRCDDVELSGGDVLLNEMRRGASDTLRSAADDIEFTPGFQLSHSTTDARPGPQPGRARSLDNRLLSTVLRI